MQIKDLTGLTFGRLIVIGKTKSDKWGKSRWICRCTCENEVIVNAGNLKSGGTKSCGCLKKELMHETKTTHGDYKNRLYHIWCLMKARCLNPNRPEYRHYGGRGITICKEWADYITFREWAMDNGYTDKLTIDRIDVNGNYCPKNCRWVDIKTQANNRRTNHFLSFNNQTLTISEWAKKTGLSQDVIFTRLSRGWTVKQTLTTPLNGGRQYA